MATVKPMPEGMKSTTAKALFHVISIGEDDGMSFCRSLPERCGVVAIPTEVFYDDKEAGRPLVRFAFCKRPEVIDEAVKRLARL